MGFSNSPLATFTHISPNRNQGRYADPSTMKEPITQITKITIHHMAGVCSLNQFDNIVSNPNRKMSSNYAIANDGKIGLFCEEKDRSWCSSSPWNDNRAITIEVSNSVYGEAGGWPISDAAYKALINLCVDICKRNGIKELKFTGNKEGSLTYHYMFSATGCPGPWIKAHTQEICDKVNAQLKTNTTTSSTTTNTNNTTTSTQQTSTTAKFAKGDLVKVAVGAKYYTGSSVPAWVVSDKWYISSISGDRAVLGNNESKSRDIQSPINTSYLTKVSGSTSTTTSTSSFKEYTKQLKASDLIYATAGGTTKGTVGAEGLYTIVQESVVSNVTYGKLKSGAGWVVVKGSVEIKKGDKVRVLKAIQYNGKSFKTYVSTYYVLEVSGDRVVISSDGRNVTAAVNKVNLQKV